MDTVSKLKVGDTTYEIEDEEARGNIIKIFQEDYPNLTFSEGAESMTEIYVGEEYGTPVALNSWVNPAGMASVVVDSINASNHSMMIKLFEHETGRGTLHVDVFCVK